ncbi:MAG: saccharopine dehydrogenase C-terminal domain-containing protein [Desulfobacterales bacterium]
MKIAVLGALGLQGRAALRDLAASPRVREILCADCDLSAWEALRTQLDTSRITPVRIDASSRRDLVGLLAQGVDAAIDLLPLSFMENAFEAAIEARVPLVSTNYGAPIRRLDGRARQAGVSLMPECGLDPGIDLVLCGEAVRRFDELREIQSYCGGIPEPAACTNPLRYKISWNFDMVLRTQKRHSVFLVKGERVEVPPERQHETELIHTVHFPGLGELEAVPNGDAAFYVELLGLGRQVRDAGRWALRWPGWCAFWRPLKRLGFLAEEPLFGPECSLTPHEAMVRLLAPQLQYGEGEKDLVVMLNRFAGLQDGRERTLTTTLLIERDLASGLFAMNRGVGIPASIVAQMLAAREIASPGILNPAVDVPYAPFMAELAARGLVVEESFT